MSSLPHAQTAISAIPRTLVTRLEVEDFLHREAALLDDWALEAWVKLFCDDGTYEVTPPGAADLENISSTEHYFLIADNHERLTHRVRRLCHPAAHAESPHSRITRLYSNLIITEDHGGQVTAFLNFIAFRTRRGINMQYFGRTRFVLVRRNDAFMIRNKRVMMNIDALVPQGTVAFLL